MNDLLTTDDVEARLRRTLAALAEDMAPGDSPARGALRPIPRDGAGPDLRPAHLRSPTPGPDARPAPLSLPDAGPASPLPPVPAESSTGRGRRRGRGLAVAAAAAVIAGGVAAVAAAAGDDDRVPVTTDAPLTTTTADPLTTTTSTEDTALGDAVLDGMYAIGEYEGGGYRIHAQFQPPDDEPWTRSDAWEQVRVGEHDGWYSSLATISELWILVPDWVVVLRGGDLPRDQLLAAGATVALEPETDRYAMPAPPGWTTVWAGEEPSPGGGGRASGAHVGRIVDSADPDARNANLIWYAGWEASDVPEGAERVDVHGQEAFVGSIAPDFAEGLQLWLLYDDGLVEVQAVGLSRDELVAAAEGVERQPGTDRFDVTPPPGFELED